MMNSTSCLVDFDEPNNAYLYYRKRKENSVRLSNLKQNLLIQFLSAMALGQIKIDNKNNHFFDENFKGYG